MAEPINWKKEIAVITELALYFVFPPAVWLGKWFSQFEEAKHDTRELFAALSFVNLLGVFGLTTIAAVAFLPIEKMRGVVKRFLKISLPILLLESICFYFALKEGERTELREELKRFLGRSA